MGDLHVLPQPPSDDPEPGSVEAILRQATKEMKNAEYQYVIVIGMRNYPATLNARILNTKGTAIELFGIMDWMRGKLHQLWG